MTTKNKAAWDGHPEAALILNLQPDFIAEVIEGQASGARLIRELGVEMCEVDRLLFDVQTLGKSPARLRGFCRELQKHFENGGRR